MSIAPPDEPRPDGARALSRRRFLRLAGLGALGAGVAGLGVRSLGSDGGDLTAAGSTSTTRRTSTTTSSTTATTGATTTTVTAQPASSTTVTAQPASSTTGPEPSTTSSTEAPATTTTEPRPPDPDGTTAGVVIFGDSGGGPAQLAVAQAMTRWAAGHRVDALVTTGDNVYDFGEPWFFAAHLDVPYAELRAAGRPLWASLGNHDVVRGHGPAQLAHLGLPELPYVKELPGVRFLVMDTNRNLAEQAAWLEAEILRPGAQGTPIPVFHAPIRSCGIHGGYQPLVDLWAPIIERHRLPLVFSGHDHLYNRFLSGGGVTYVVTGGGGRDLYAHTPGCGGPELQATHVKHHFVGLEVMPDRLVVTAVDPADAVLDRVEIPVPARLPALAGQP